MYGRTGSKAPRNGGTPPNTVEYSPSPPSLSGAQNTSHCNYQPTLTAGRLAQLGRTHQGGGSFRPYNHPPPAVGNPQSKAAATLYANQATSAASTASAKSATPTSMLGCAVQSATALLRQCACRGMLAPRIFTGGSPFHVCHEPNCPAHFKMLEAHFYQCTNCLNILCPQCRSTKPKHVGPLPND